MNTLITRKFRNELTRETTSIKIKITGNVALICESMRAGRDICPTYHRNLTIEDARKIWNSFETKLSGEKMGTWNIVETTKTELAH